MPAAVASKSSTSSTTSQSSAHTPETVPGMGALYSQEATTFRVWAPHADAVAVTGDFTKWSKKGIALTHEAEGYWAVAVEGVKPGEAYAYQITTDGHQMQRVDPYAREVRGDGDEATSVIYDTKAFDWSGDDFQMPSWNDLVIYELHVGSFKADTSCGSGTFATVASQLPYLQALGINAIKMLPPAEFDGEQSWGYNPNYPYAVETAYGGPDELKKLVKQAHQHGIAVIIDVVYNHLGPSGKHLWQFDGWSENDGGGIYFYQDERAETPWGHTRLNYSSPDVRRYIVDNAIMWLDEYRADGLRVDSVSHIRAIKGDPSDPAQDLPDGWRLLQEMNRAVHEKFPWKLTIAEDLLCNDWVTKPADQGGAGFDSQWDCNFLYPLREVLAAPADEERKMDDVQKAVTFMYGGEAFNRVIFTESHDAVAEGMKRVPVEVDAENPDGYFAVKRSLLGIVLAATSPGIPMIFQGQEFLSPEEFSFPQKDCLNWDLAEQNAGIVRLVSDTFKLRRNLEGRSAGLAGQSVEVLHRSDSAKMFVFHRWLGEGGPKNDVVVVCNFSAEPRIGYRIPLPSNGHYDNLLNTAAKIYHEGFTDIGPLGVEAEQVKQDGKLDSALVDVGPYSILVLGRA